MPLIPTSLGSGIDKDRPAVAAQAANLRALRRPTSACSDGLSPGHRCVVVQSGSALIPSASYVVAALSA